MGEVSPLEAVVVVVVVVPPPEAVPEPAKGNKNFIVMEKG